MKKLTLFAILAIVVIPLVVIAAPQDTLRKAIVHIATMQDENGAWSRLKGEFPSEAEPTAWAMKALAMNGVAPEKVDKGVAFLLKDQKPDGSWNNNTANVGFVILALKQVNKGEEAIKKGIQYLRDVQDVDGGFKRLGKEGAPLTIYTAVVLVALKEAGIPRNDPMVRMAIDWLMGCQNADGGYGMPKGTPSYGIEYSLDREGAYRLQRCTVNTVCSGCRRTVAENAETYWWFFSCPSCTRGPRSNSIYNYGPEQDSGQEDDYRQGC